MLFTILNDFKIFLIDPLFLDYSWKTGNYMHSILLTASIKILLIIKKVPSLKQYFLSKETS